jgi:hypothetical protein
MNNRRHRSYLQNSSTYSSEKNEPIVNDDTSKPQTQPNCSERNDVGSKGPTSAGIHPLERLLLLCVVFILIIIILVLAQVESKNEIQIDSLKHNIFTLYESILALKLQYKSLNELYNQRLQHLDSVYAANISKSHEQNLLPSSQKNHSLGSIQANHPFQQGGTQFYRNRRGYIIGKGARNRTNGRFIRPEPVDHKLENLSYFLYNATANYTAKTYDMIRSEAYAAIYSKGVTRSYKNEYGPFLTKGQYYEYRHNYSDKCLVSNQRRGYSYGLEISV